MIRNLVLATWAFAITFWAWNLIGPLSATYSDDLDLSATQTSMLVAVPVLVGSLGRIPVGMLADRLGGRTMFAAACFVTIIPVVFVGYSDSYASLLIWGFVLGIGGTSFAVGIPFVNAWYPPERRGFATGVFGAGMGGTALSAFFTPRLSESIGRAETHLLIAAALAVTGVIMLLASRNAPDWRPGTEPALPRMVEALRLKATWQGCALYAVAFGGFVALSTYLPTLLKNTYGFSQTEAGMRTAGFSIAAVIARPLGGILSDKIGPRRVLLISLAATSVLAVLLSFKPAAEVPAGATYVLIAFALGLGTGGVFALIAKQVEPARVGTVTGLVGAAGGLGGYFPPLVMGTVYGITSSYAIGYLLLALTAAAATVYVFAMLRSPTPAPRAVNRV